MESLGPDPADGGVDMVADVCVSVVKERKGEGATSGRWNRARKSFGDGCDGSFVTNGWPACSVMSTGAKGDGPVMPGPPALAACSA
jgi:hypothetical protein